MISSGFRFSSSTALWSDWLELLEMSEIAVQYPFYVLSLTFFGRYLKSTVGSCTVLWLAYSWRGLSLLTSLPKVYFFNWCLPRNSQTWQQQLLWIIHYQTHSYIDKDSHNCFVKMFKEREVIIMKKFRYNFFIQKKYLCQIVWCSSAVHTFLQNTLFNKGGMESVCMPQLAISY